MSSISVFLIYFSLQYIQVIQISICLIHLQHRGFVFEFSATFRLLLPGKLFPQFTGF